MTQVPASPVIRCSGIQWHQDTQWQRCPKAGECQRYVNRHLDSGARISDRLCRTVEFEHFVRAQ